MAQGPIGAAQAGLGNPNYSAQDHQRKNRQNRQKRGDPQPAPGFSWVGEQIAGFRCRHQALKPDSSERDCDIILNIIMDEAIRVEGLFKRFGSVTAVHDVSFHVKPGEIFGILGPNGAGKTTTLEIIEGLQKPTEGQVHVLGMDVLREPARIKARIGVQLQSSAYFDYLTLSEILALLGSFYPKRVPPAALLEQVGLQGQAAQRVRHLSGGQKQRFTVAASLVNDPELVILDEPTTGLDPLARRNLWELIQEIHRQGVTVVLTTHYMDEAEALCHPGRIWPGANRIGPQWCADEASLSFYWMAGAHYTSRGPSAGLCACCECLHGLSHQEAVSSTMKLQNGEVGHHGPAHDNLVDTAEESCSNGSESRSKTRCVCRRSLSERR